MHHGWGRAWDNSGLGEREDKDCRFLSWENAWRDLRIFLNGATTFDNTRMDIFLIVANRWSRSAETALWYRKTFNTFLRG